VLLERRPSRVSRIIEPDISREGDPDAIRRHPVYLDTVDGIWQDIKKYLD
jgi:NitT/TauT family transport system ATP-binding protein